jgi:hypothetical protein
MVKGVTRTAKEEEPIEENALSCTFCGPGTWSTWEIVTDDCVLFACDRHQAEMSQAKIIRLERIGARKPGKKFADSKETIYEEENQNYFDDLQEINDYE